MRQSVTVTATATATVAVLVTIAPRASARPPLEEALPVAVAPYAEQVATLDGKSEGEYLSPPGEYDYIYVRHLVSGYY